MSIRRKSFLFALVLVAGSAPIVKSDQIYVESTNSHFGLLDPQTGAYTLIGVTSEIIGGMGFTVDGSLYGLGQNSVLYRINTTTGDLTTIGNTGLNLNNGWGMGDTQDGTLYAVTANKLYTVEPTNANATFLGNTGFNSSCGPTGDASGNLYNGQGEFGSGFYQINRTTGLGTLLGNASYGHMTALAFTDSTMYAINQTGSIYKMNLTNGASTLVSTYNTIVVGNVYTSAVRITAAPETSTLTIGSLAGLMVGVGWLRRRRSQQ